MKIEDIIKDTKATDYERISFRLTHVPTGVSVSRHNINQKWTHIICDAAMKELEEKVEKPKS
jgi:hypothetical protein